MQHPQGESEYLSALLTVVRPVADRRSATRAVHLVDLAQRLSFHAHSRGQAVDVVLQTDTQKRLNVDAEKMMATLLINRDIPHRLRRLVPHMHWLRSRNLPTHSYPLSRYALEIRSHSSWTTSSSTYIRSVLSLMSPASEKHWKGRRMLRTIRSWLSLPQ